MIASLWVLSWFHSRMPVIDSRVQYICTYWPMTFTYILKINPIILLNKAIFVPKIKLERPILYVLEFFQKVVILGWSEGRGLVLNPTKWFYIWLFIIFGGLEAKNAIFQKFWYLKMSILNFSGALGGPPVKKFCKKWFLILKSPCLLNPKK